MTPQPTPTPPAPRDVYATFCGPIDEASVSRFAHWLAMASQGPSLRSAHILFQSSGGTVGDGVFLYNLLRAMPFDVTLYNAGSVGSIAAVAFLGAKHRKVGAGGVFMLHRTTFVGAPATAQQLRVRVDTLTIDDQRAEAILHKHLRLDDNRWDDLNRNDIWFAADEAVSVGFADAVADFALPVGSSLMDFNAHHLA